jgi:hypothetical protein
LRRRNVSGKLNSTGLSRVLAAAIVFLILVSIITIGFLAYSRYLLPNPAQLSSPMPSMSMFSPTQTPIAITPLPTLTFATSTPIQTIAPTETPTYSDASPNFVIALNKTYGGSDREFGNEVIQTADGAYVIAGATSSYSLGGVDSYGSRLADGWLIKIDAKGDEVWSRTYGEKDYWDELKSIVLAKDGTYVVAGGYSSFFWIAKIDPDGNMMWSKKIGGTGFGSPYSIVQTIDGGFAIAGMTESFGAGKKDILLVKTDSDGNVQWNMTYGGTKDDWVYNGDCLVQTTDKGYAIAGFTNSFGAGNDDFWLVKTDSIGNELWSKTFGGSGDDEARSIVQTTEGGYAILGCTKSFGSGSFDIWLVKTDEKGDLLWSKTYGETNNSIEYGISIVNTKDGGYALGGQLWTSRMTHKGILLIKTDSSGNQVWNMTYGGALEFVFESLIQTSDGGYAMTGYDVGGYGMAADIWIMKVDIE